MSGNRSSYVPAGRGVATFNVNQWRTALGKHSLALSPCRNPDNSIALIVDREDDGPRIRIEGFDQGDRLRQSDAHRLIDGNGPDFWLFIRHDDGHGGVVRLLRHVDDGLIIYRHLNAADLFVLLVANLKFLDA